MKRAPVPRIDWGSIIYFTVNALNLLDARFFKAEILIRLKIFDNSAPGINVILVVK